MTSTIVPNHHGHHPGFRGVSGLVAALTMIRGRDGDARLAAGLVDVHPGDAVVDVGCGPGVAIRNAARLGADAIGVDPASVMLRVAKLLTFGRKVRYLTGVAADLPLPDEHATVLWSLSTVHHWPDLDAGLREARRVLRSGGRFLAIERRTQAGAQGLASHGWTTEQAEAFAARCETHGFTDAIVQRHDTGRRKVVSVRAIAP